MIKEVATKVSARPKVPPVMCVSQKLGHSSFPMIQKLGKICICAQLPMEINWEWLEAE